MHDELNAIRRLYGVPGTEGDLPDAPTESEIELEALASAKAALDRLPPQRPDASVIDAVVAAAGEAARAAALGPIRAVYDEEPEPLVSAQAEAEAAALASVKAALDALPRQRPDASVIDAVVAAAAAPAGPAPVVATTGRAADRPAERPARRRVVAALSAVFAVVLVFGGGLWMNRDAATPQEFVADRFEAEREVGAEEPAADNVSPADEAPPVAEAPAGASTEALSGSADVDGVRERVASAAPPPSAANRSVESDDVQVASARRAAPATAPPASAPSAVPSFSFADAAADADGLVLASEETLPLTDGDEELQLLYLRVREMQAAQAGLGWDTPPVSLGAAPDSTPAATGWMQVRVQR